MTRKDPVKRALIISLVVSAVSLSIKIGAFLVTGSTGALADSAESVVHFFAVIFVVYGYYISLKPADEDHYYGHERIEFLSVGAEGAIIIAAGLTIIYHAIRGMVVGIEIVNLDTGILMLIVAALINLILGTYLVRTGKKYNNMLAISNGKHTLTDVWTSSGVVLSLLIITFTGWLFVDILVSLAIAGYISFEAYKLLRYSIAGIMDTRDKDADAALKRVLGEDLPGSIINWHHLRHRTVGRTTWIELHLVFSDDISLEKAHMDATLLERKMIDAIKNDAIITLHLEPLKAHDQSHEILKGANRQKDLDDFA